MGAGGSPTKYDPEMNDKVTMLCMLGVTDKDIGDYLGVVESTINNWKKEHPEFLESIKKGKIEADMRVAKSLYTKAIEGDTTAMIFFLKNRRGKYWNEKKTVDLNFKGSLNAALEDDFGGDE